jgi:outer membrane autotransporter protein
VSVGLFVGAGKSKTDFEVLNSDIDSDFRQGGLIAAFSFTKAFSLVADLSITKFSNESKKIVPTLDVLTADYSQNIFSLGLEASYGIRLGSAATVKPFFEVRYQSLSQSEVTESGGSLAQSLEKISLDKFTTTLGLDLSYDFVSSRSLVVSPKLSLAWRHEFGDRQARARAEYVGSPGFFIVESLKSDRDQGLVGVALDVQPGGPDGVLALELGYEFGVSANTKEHNFYLTVDVSW